MRIFAGSVHCLFALASCAATFVDEETALVQTVVYQHGGEDLKWPAERIDNRVSQPLSFDSQSLFDSTKEAVHSILFLEGASVEHEYDEKKAKSACMLKQLAVPIAAILLGCVCLQAEATKLLGKLALFFGAQTFMNLYMKAVLSKSTVSSEHGLRGIPAAFAVTAIQQLVSFFLLVVGTFVSRATPWKYTPKMLTTPKQLGMVLLFSLSFTLNIALNNFSLSLLDISVNLIIRSVAPLTTLIVQVVFMRCLGKMSFQPIEVGLMIAGVICGLIAVFAKGQGGEPAGGESSHLVVGGFICLFSLFCASSELVMAGVLGSGLGLNPVDTTFYMALPSTMLLLLPIFFVPHPIKWPGYGPMTDWAILREVVGLSPGTFCLALLSGIFALTYNVLLYTIVQTLSAPFSAFTSNFNKAATIALSLLLGFEMLPSAPWGMVMVVGIVGNMGAFTLYGLYKTLPKGSKK